MLERIRRTPVFLALSIVLLVGLLVAIGGFTRAMQKPVQDANLVVPTPSSTATGITEEEKKYQRALDEAGYAYQDAFIVLVVETEYAAQLPNAVYEEDWQKRMTQDLVGLERAVSEINEMPSPPDRYRSIDALMRNLASKTTIFVATMQKAISSKQDTDFLQAANDLRDMNQAWEAASKAWLLLR